MLAGQLDQLWEDLDQKEKKVLTTLRSPLDRGDPTRDMDRRLKDHEVRAPAGSQTRRSSNNMTVQLPK